MNKYKNSLFLLCLFVFSFSFHSCTWVQGLFEAPLEFEACDPTHSLYDKKNHFFHRDFVDEEGNLDQRKWWLGALRAENSPCNPLKKKSSEP